MKYAVIAVWEEDGLEENALINWYDTLEEAKEARAFYDEDDDEADYIIVEERENLDLYKVEE